MTSATTPLPGVGSDVIALDASADCVDALE
jgi:hypothetical protein